MIYHNLPASFSCLVGKPILKADLLPSITLPILKAVSLVVLMTVLFIAEKFMLVLLKAVLFNVVLFNATLLYSWEVTIIKDVAVIMASSPIKYIKELFIYLPLSRAHNRI
jgi:hypothetical protein